MRLNGASYEEIAAAGGGILNSMRGTHALTRNELLKLARERVKTIHSYGVGTIEVKSGYGLTFDKEYELSHVIHDLKISCALKCKFLTPLWPLTQFLKNTLALMII